MTPVVTTLIIAICVSVPLIALGIIFIVIAIKNKRKAQASAAWPTTVAEITSASVDESVEYDEDSGQTRTYKADIRYVYTVGGVVYESKQISFGASASSSRRAAEDLVARYTPGVTVTAYYNPEKPSEAVLQTQAKGSNIFMIVGIVLLVIGVIIICAGTAIGLMAALSG